MTIRAAEWSGAAHAAEENGVRVLASGMTSRGRVRPDNQDQFLIADLSKAMSVDRASFPPCAGSLYRRGSLFLVADGLGGHAAGARASRSAAEFAASFLLRAACVGTGDAHELGPLLHGCHAAVRREAAGTEGLRGMGTTLTLAYVLWPTVHIGHVGDSRCYRVRGSAADQLTTDHTYAQQLVEAGILTPQQAVESRWGSSLWNAIGGECQELRPEVLRQTLEVGDVLVLCTDGLSGHVDAEEIGEIVEQERSPERACQRLVDLAEDRGGEDNATVVIASFS